MLTLNLVDPSSEDLAFTLVEAGISPLAATMVAFFFLCLFPVRDNGKLGFDRVFVSWHRKGASKVVRVEIEEG